MRVLSLLILALCLSSCTRTGLPVVGVIPKGASHQFWLTVQAGAIKAGQEYGLEIEWNAPALEIDGARQIDIVQSMVTRKLAGIAIAPVDRKALVSVLERASAQGIPVAVYDNFTARDVHLSVQFKPISGTGDQGAGLVWRYRDQNNYYLARCNALENTCTIYRVANGQRETLSSQSVTVASNTWHTLRVEAGGDQFVVSYDGKKVLDAKDGTFKDSGKVGLWTKADSIIYFDDLSMVGT